MCFLYPQNMCFPHWRHVWGMWDHLQSISEGKLSLIIPLPTPKTQILTKVMFFGCKNTYFICKNRWITGKNHVFSTWRTHLGHLRPSPINFWWKTTSVETNNYFGMNRISNIIRLMKVERIEYRILFAYQENIRILFEYLEIFEYLNIFD